MKKILILSSRIPYPLVGGDRIRIYNTAKTLSKNYEIDLLCLNEGRVESEYVDKLKEVFNEVICFSYHSLRFKWNALKGFFLKKSLQVSYYYFREVQKWMDDNYRRYGLIFCNHIRTVEYMRGIDCPKMVDLHDAISMNYALAATKAKGFWKIIYGLEGSRILPYEIETINRFDKSFIVSDRDRNYLIQRGARAKKIVTVPVAVKEEVINRSFSVKQKYEIAFLGKMDYPPNTDAVLYFAKNVFPKLRKSDKKLKFIIIGANPPKIVSELIKIKGIEVTGFVEDPYEYIEASKVFVAPMRFGAGVQNKILEAMALKKPVVTTTLGAGGIKGREGEHFLVANEPEKMVEEILNLLEDGKRRRSIGEKARALVEEKYTWERIGKQFLKEIEEVPRG